MKMQNIEAVDVITQGCGVLHRHPDVAVRRRMAESIKLLVDYLVSGDPELVDEALEIMQEAEGLAVAQ